MTDPVLPYGGDEDPNSGYRAQDQAGITGRRQRLVLDFVHQRGDHGATWHEVSEHLGMHHGSASAALSNLHRGNRLARLSVTRRQSRVYVDPVFVNDRDTEPAGITKTTALLDEMADLLGRRPMCTHGPLPIDGCWSCEARAVLQHYDNRAKGSP
jgi:hypothetical protein